MKKELNPYDYYYESSGQSAMMVGMVANGHNGLHTMHHPFNLEDNFLQILGKNESLDFSCSLFWMGRNESENAEQSFQICLCEPK